MTFHETKSSNNFITLAGEKKWHPITSWRNDVNPATQPWDVKSPVDTPSLKLTFSHLKMDGWKTIVSFRAGLFLGAMFVLGRVHNWMILENEEQHLLNQPIIDDKCQFQTLDVPSGKLK